MSKLFGSLKTIFSSKKSPKYKVYSAGELKIIAMKSRLILDQIYQKSLSKIQQFDSQLIQIVQKSSGNINHSVIQHHYGLLQEIGKKVVEVQSIKIYIQILKKIESNSQHLINTNGDIAKMKQQVRWFQCILWYRKCHQIKNLQEIYQFCFNFFKGMDITMEINVKCQIFQIYPILKYLSANIVLPLEILMIDIIHYITPKISDQIMEQIYKINHHELKKWINFQKKQAKNRSISKSPRNISYSPSPKKKVDEKMSKSNVYEINYQKAQSAQTNIQKFKNQQLNSNREKIIFQKQNKKDKINPFQSFGKTQNTELSKIDLRQQNQSPANKQNSLKKISLSRLFSNESYSKASQKSQTFSIQKNQSELSQQSEINLIQKSKKPSLSRLFSGNKSNLIDQKQEFQSKQFQNNQRNQKQIKLQQMQKQLSNQQWGKQNEENYQNIKIQKNDQKLEVKKQFPLQESKGQENDEQKYFDQQQSLQFIRECIVVQKKGIKKAYMVSIYGRQQYLNMKK